MSLTKNFHKFEQIFAFFSTPPAYFCSVIQT